MTESLECSECAADLAPNQKFCGSCGIEIEWPSVSDEEKSVPEKCAHKNIEVMASGTYCWDCVQYVNKKDLTQNDEHEIAGQFAVASSDYSKKATRYSRKQQLVAVAGGIVVLLIILAISKGSQNNSDIQSGGDSSVTATSQDSSTSSGQPSTSELVSAFSAGLGLSVNQSDVARGVTFPSISKSVDIWSAPYFSLLIYPSSGEQSSDAGNFQSDYSTLNSSRSWESCQNFVAVFSPEMQSKVDSVVSKWCTSSSPTPSSDGVSNSWYPSGYSEVSKGVAFKALPVDSYTCDYGTICLEAYVEVKGGCSDSLYAEVNFLDSSGTIVDYGNHMSGVVPPKTPVLMTFTTTNPNAQSYKVTTTNCYQR
jgi:hypothetical protein